MPLSQYAWRHKPGFRAKELDERIKGCGHPGITLISPSLWLKRPFIH